MDIEKEIATVCMKRDVIRIARWIGTDQKRFSQLMDFILTGEDRIAQKAAWIVGYCVELHPPLVDPWLKQLLQKMEQPRASGAVKRNGVRILQFATIPRKLQGRAANICFQFLAAPDEPIAVRTFSITVIARIAEEEPDLMKELESVVKQMLPYSTPAFRARAKKVLKNYQYTEPIESP
ncbi:MAG: hypothetical protein V1799_08085 [bacterium]